MVLFSVCIVDSDEICKGCLCRHSQVLWLQAYLISSLSSRDEDGIFQKGCFLYEGRILTYHA